MKHGFFIFITCILLLLSSCTQNADDAAIKSFNEFLGAGKAEAMNEALNSFEEFLEVNYPESESESERIRLFLEQLEIDYKLDSLWVLNILKNRELMKAWEQSGLRKEIWIYGYEKDSYKPKHDIYELLSPDDAHRSKESDSITDFGDLELDLTEDSVVPISELDSIWEADREKWRNYLVSNPYGDFYYGLAKYGADDYFVSEYVKLMMQINPPPSSLITALLDDDNKVNFNKPFIRRIILVEVYLPLIFGDIMDYDERIDN